MLADSLGNSIFNELTLPFKGNPNISIQPVVVKQGILLHGTYKAVQAAKEHFGRALDKQLSVDKYVPRVCLIPLKFIRDGEQ